MKGLGTVRGQPADSIADIQRLLETMDLSDDRPVTALLDATVLELMRVSTELQVFRADGQLKGKDGDTGVSHEEQPPALQGGERGLTFVDLARPLHGRRHQFATPLDELADVVGRNVAEPVVVQRSRRKRPSRSGCPDGCVHGRLTI